MAAVTGKIRLPTASKVPHALSYGTPPAPHPTILNKEFYLLVHYICTQNLSNHLYLSII